MTNLRECVRSAASVVSGSVLGLEAREPAEPPGTVNVDIREFVSELGDSLNHDSDFILDWVYRDGRVSNALGVVSEAPVDTTAEASRGSRIKPSVSTSGLTDYILPPIETTSGLISPLPSPEAATERGAGTDDRPKESTEDRPKAPKENESDDTDDVEASASQERKRNRRSLFGLFSFSKPKDRKPLSQVGGRRKYQSGTIVRRKLVFVGDGACGKTCMLM